MGETWNPSDGLPVTVEQVRDAERQLAADPIRLPENLRDPDVVWERIMSRPKRERSTYRVGITAPSAVSVHCQEVYEAIQREGQRKGESH